MQQAKFLAAPEIDFVNWGGCTMVEECWRSSVSACD